MLKITVARPPAPPPARVMQVAAFQRNSAMRKNRSFLNEVDFTLAKLRWLLRLAEALKWATYEQAETGCAPSLSPPTASAAIAAG